jgi:hypothetical protein
MNVNTSSTQSHHDFTIPSVLGAHPSDPCTQKLQARRVVSQLWQGHHPGQTQYKQMLINNYFRQPCVLVVGIVQPGKFEIEVKTKQKPKFQYAF